MSDPVDIEQDKKIAELEAEIQLLKDKKPKPKLSYKEALVKDIDDRIKSIGQKEPIVENFLNYEKLTEIKKRAVKLEDDFPNA